jgi:ribose 5-phosphate isomerase B
MRIVLGNDHRGLGLKKAIINFVAGLDYEYEDFGCHDTSSVDYPDIAQAVAEAVSAGKFDYGILVCGSGIGMCIAANKIKGIRAALCRDVFDATRARQHNDANILCLGSDTTGPGPAMDIVKTFLTTDFEGGRHSLRVDKIRSLEPG